MSNIHTAYCIISVDHDKKQNFILSTKKETTEFPIIQIEHPKFLHNETRYHFSNFFLKDTYNPEVIKSISFSYTDIQNELLIKYVDEKAKELDTNNDLFMLCGAIIEKTYSPNNNFSWNLFEFSKSFDNTDLVISIIDFVIGKSIL